MKKPGFLIVGAAKSGTTSLSNYLGSHPDIFIPDAKELRYFASKSILQTSKNDPLLPGILRQSVLNKKDYYNSFSNSHKINGESSVHYLYHYDEAIPKIKNELGDIPIIIILRNPVDRAVSNWSFIGKEFLPFKEAFLLEDERKKSGFNAFWYYKSLGLYFKQVRAYIDNFTKVKIILFEDFSNSTDKVVKSIFKFLDVDENCSVDTNRIYNKGDKIRTDIDTYRHLISYDIGYRLVYILYKNTYLLNNIIISKKSESKNINRSDYLSYFNDDILNLNKILPDHSFMNWIYNYD